MKMEKIQIISNQNTINLRELKKNKPLSYAFFCLKQQLSNSGMDLHFVNQDKNRVYLRIHNKINNYTSSIIDFSYEELLSMNMFTLNGLLTKVWDKTI